MGYSSRASVHQSFRTDDTIAAKPFGLAISNLVHGLHADDASQLKPSSRLLLAALDRSMGRCSNRSGTTAKAFRLPRGISRGNPVVYERLMRGVKGNLEAKRLGRQSNEQPLVASTVMIIASTDEGIRLASAIPSMQVVSLQSVAAWL